MNIFRTWFNRLASNPQLVTLILILAFGVLAVVLAGQLVAPVLAAVVLAYLLEGPVGWLTGFRVPRTAAAALVSVALLLGVVWVTLLLMPLLSRQAGQILQELPDLVDRLQHFVNELPTRYPSFITHGQIDSLTSTMSLDVSDMRKTLLSRSLEFGASLVYFAVYLVLVPLMVFFMLRDKRQLLSWLGRFMPYNNGLLVHVWQDINTQLSNYIRGKAVEIIIVWVVAYAVFTIFGLHYAMLLSALVGFSVLIPYVGAFGMTIPIMLVAYAQWGLTMPTLWMLVAYTILQILDGNLLVPILFSEAVDLHPVAIITAILFFGGIWGLWGVFFAIPLATVVNAVIKAWPHHARALADEEDNVTE